MVIISDDNDENASSSDPPELFRYWRTRIPNFEAIQKDAVGDLGLVWELSPVRIADDAIAQRHHSEEIIAKRLRRSIWMWESLVF